MTCQFDLISDALGVTIESRSRAARTSDEDIGGVLGGRGRQIHGVERRLPARGVL